MEGIGFQESDGRENDFEIVEAEVELFEVPEQSGMDLNDGLIAFSSAPSEPAPASLQIDSGSVNTHPSTTASAGQSLPPRRSTAVRPPSSETKPRPKLKTISTLQLPATGTISRAWGIFTFSPLPFLIIALLASLAEIAIAVSVMINENNSLAPVLSVLPEVIASVFQGVASYATFQIIRKNSVEVGQAFSKGLSHILPVIGASLLLILITQIGTIPAFLAIQSGMNSLLANFLFVRIPELVFLCMFLLTVPVCVVERLGPVASLKRSMELSKGFRWAIFWVLAVWYIYIGFILAGINIVLMFIGILVSPWVSLIFIVLAFLAMTAVKSILIAVIYHDLRIMKDGITTDKLVRVFD